MSFGDQLREITNNSELNEVQHPHAVMMELWFETNILPFLMNVAKRGLNSVQFMNYMDVNKFIILNEQKKLIQLLCNKHKIDVTYDSKCIIFSWENQPNDD